MAKVDVNRDAGLSSKIEEAGVPDIMKIIEARLKGEMIAPPYTIEDMAAAIPGAKLMIIDGMGHDPPHGGAWPEIIDAVVSHTHKT